MRRDVFQAVADPTRREIIGLLVQGELNLNAVADNFRVSRPAISKHVKILQECGLVEIRKTGRERYCKAKPEKLNEISTWVEQYRDFWNERFDALELYLDKLQRENSSTANPIKKRKNGRQK